MEIRYINGKAHELYRIEIPESEKTQKAIMDFMKSTLSDVTVEERHDNGTAKAISAYVPCSYAENLRGLLISS